MKSYVWAFALLIASLIIYGEIRNKRTSSLKSFRIKIDIPKA